MPNVDPILTADQNAFTSETLFPFHYSLDYPHLAIVDGRIAGPNMAVLKMQSFKQTAATVEDLGGDRVREMSGETSAVFRGIAVEQGYVDHVSLDVMNSGGCFFLLTATIQREFHNKAKTRTVEIKASLVHGDDKFTYQ